MESSSSIPTLLNASPNVHIVCRPHTRGGGWSRGVGSTRVALWPPLPTMVNPGCPPCWSRPTSCLDQHGSLSVSVEAMHNPWKSLPELTCIGVAHSFHPHNSQRMWTPRKTLARSVLHPLPSEFPAVTTLGYDDPTRVDGRGRACGQSMHTMENSGTSVPGIVPSGVFHSAHTPEPCTY
jgi:hypothetical protein